MIALYLDEIKDCLSSYEWIRLVETIRCDFEENDLKRILCYRFRIFLTDGSQLEMVERIVQSKKRWEYSFHEI